MLVLRSAPSDTHLITIRDRWGITAGLILYSRTHPPLDRQTRRVGLPRLSRSLERPIRQSSNHIHIRPDTLHPCHVMTHTLHERNRLIVVAIFHLQHVRRQLVMEPRCHHSLLTGHALIQHVPETLNDARNDLGSAGGRRSKVERAVLGKLDYRWGDAGERALAAADVVVGRRLVAELVDCVGDGEVIHLVVHDDAGLGYHDVRAKEGVDGCGEGDGHAGGVTRYHGRGTGAFVGLARWTHGTQQWMQ